MTETPPLERKLVAILAADVVGYSRLMHDDEERTLATLTAHRAVIDELIAKGRGQMCRCWFDGAGRGRLNRLLNRRRRHGDRFGRNLWLDRRGLRQAGCKLVCTRVCSATASAISSSLIGSGAPISIAIMSRSASS